MKYQSGNTLVEYNLIGALIALGCVAVCLTFGKNFADIIGDLKADMTAHHQIAMATSTKVGALSTSTSSSSSSSSTSVSSLLKMTQQEQTLLEQPLDQKLQTTGANGTTELLAKQLDLLAAQLLAEGKITEAQSNAIISLANQGHHMADMEALIEQAALSGQSSVMIDGQSYGLWDLGSQLGFMAVGPQGFETSDVLSADYVGNVEPELAKFIALYQEVLASGAASDPIVAATIQSAATQIASVGEAVEDSTYYGAQADINDQLASRVTQMNSSKICTAGSFKDNGVLCSP